MARPERPRSLGEQLELLARILRQIDASRDLPAERARLIKSALSEAMSHIQSQLSKRV